LKQLEPWKLLALDTSSEESINAAAKTLEGVPVNLLINNAGIMDVHDLQSTTKADLLRHFEVNAVGPFVMTRALLPNLRLAVAATGSAFVAQVTSRMGSISDNGSGGYYGYRASKTALNMLTKSLAIDLEKDKIGCLLLHPGYVNTAMVGFQGAVSPEDSVKGLTKIIARAKLEDSAKMFHFEKGDVLPW
jgi:NAD(P)-dependent dehydrogenase (short-subunit alcohol dehydrogenase family)